MQGPGPSLHIQALAPATVCLADSEMGDTGQRTETGSSETRVYDGSTKRYQLLGEWTTG